MYYTKDKDNNKIEIKSADELVKLLNENGITNFESKIIDKLYKIKSDDEDFSFDPIRFVEEFKIVDFNGLIDMFPKEVEDVVIRMNEGNNKVYEMQEFDYNLTRRVALHGYVVSQEDEDLFLVWNLDESFWDMKQEYLNEGLQLN